MNQYAYELATSKRESRMGNTMNEGGGDAYFERNYGYKTHHRVDLQNTKPGDGAKYKGRGLVQTTGFKNYNDFTHKFADENFQHDGKPIDLVNHPELATDPAIAARMGVEGMRDGSFTGRKLGNYINDKQTDFVGARRVINGTDHADEIAAQATAFQSVLKHHSGDYADAVIAAQLKGLPSAEQGQLAGSPAAPSAALFDHKPMAGGAHSFVAPDKLLKNNLGRFDPTEKAPAKLDIAKTHPISE
jgi:hypothetical protein